MKYSKLFGKTIREAPAGATIVSHQLLYRAGYLRESVAGRYFILPLGQRVENKITKIIKEEMDRVGGQEMVAPIMHPLELWKETNRTNTAGFELMKVKDRRGAEFALGGTAEEMFVDVVRKFNISYRDLPFNIYQFSNKFRDEIRASGGLLRVREFVMKDAYSFDANAEEFAKHYEEMAKTYARIFDRMGLKTSKVLSDNGYIGGEYCHEYVVESSVGESKYFVSEDGKYVAHEEVAKFYKDPKNVDEELKPLQVVDAIRGTTMEDGVKLHGLPLWQQIKDVLFVDDKNRFILAIIRGDYDVNEIKLKHVGGSITLRHATEDEIRNILHSEPGFISPIGIKEKKEKKAELLIIVDDSLRTVRNSYGGANALNRDSLNMNIDRDFKPDVEGDIALVKDGFLAEDGNQKLVSKVGIEVGNIFQLGYHYTHLMKGATFIDKDGQEKPYYMGCYGIGTGRTMAAIVESYHDEHGIVWPESVAPYKYHLVGLNGKGEDVYQKLLDAGVEILFDDRDVSAGEKFADADLIGCPFRLVVSNKTGDQVELKNRKTGEVKLVSAAELT